jgi:parvulin-like peptidyl-prolyl isomerase
MIKKVIYISSLIFMLSPQISLADNNKNEIIASVNGQNIYMHDIQNKIEEYLEVNNTSSEAIKYDQLEQSEKNEVIKNIVIADLIILQAKEAKINESKEYKQTIKFIENQVIQKLFLEQLVKKVITEKAIQEKYQQIAMEYKNLYEYKVSHILVSTEEEAKSIKIKLDNGADFSALAKEYSIDSNKEDGGNLGYFTKGQMVEPFEKAAFNLKLKEISEPVATDFGYHIIILEDKRLAVAPTIEELKPKIIDELTGQIIQKYIQELKNKYKVEFF